MLTLSLFNHKRDATPKAATRTWAQICAKIKTPAIRADKDGPLFSPATFSPAHRRKENVQTVSLLCLDFDHNVDWRRDLGVWRTLGVTFAAYTTHSHQRVTDSHTTPEDCFRLLLPLAEPIPAADYPALWQWAARITGGVIDASACDASRMFYTPVKASPDAAYLYAVHDGSVLDWRALGLETQAPPEFATYEARHAELVRRVMERGKRNSKGNYDAKCLAHNGNSATGLVYFPDTGRVECLKKTCDYQALLRAEGLPDDHLPKHAHGPAVSDTTTQGKPEAALRIVRMADVAPESVSWLWYPYIPIGKLTLLEGDGGLGKSWLAVALATAVSLGRGLPNAEHFTPANVLMLSAEDGLGDTLRPRLDAFGADVSRIFALAQPLTLDAVGLLRLQAAIAEHGPRLVVIDPLFAYTGGKMDIHRANEARSLTSPLADIAAKLGCAIIAVRHLAKSRGMGHAANAGIGSIDFYAAARSVLMVGADPDEKNQRAMVQTKNNLAPLGQALGFKLEAGQFYWTGASTLTASRLLALPRNEEQRDSDNEQRTAHANAAAVLRDLLTGQALPAAEAQTEMKTAGFTPYATRQACERLGIKPFKRGYQPSVWMWQLPVEDVEDSLEDVENNNLRHLRVNADTKASYGNSLVEDVEGLFSSTSSTSSTSSDNDTKASYGNSLVEDVEGLVSSTSSDSNLEREVYTI